MDLIAGKKCYYRGWRKAGERFSAPRQFARSLVASKQATIAPEVAPRTYPTRAIPAEATERVVMQPETVDEMKALRAEYRKKFGKGPGPSWKADTLREKIAAA